MIRAGLDKVDPDGELEWAERVERAYVERIGLSALAHYTTPGLSFSADDLTGRPFAYHVYGAAVVESTVDVLRGTARIDRVADRPRHRAQHRPARSTVARSRAPSSRGSAG